MRDTLLHYSPVAFPAEVPAPRVVNKGPTVPGVARQVLLVARQVLLVARQVLLVARQVLLVARQVLLVARQVFLVAGQVLAVARRQAFANPRADSHLKVRPARRRGR